MDTLRMLTRADLRELGLKIGDCRRLMVYLNMGEEVRAYADFCRAADLCSTSGRSRAHERKQAECVAGLYISLRCC